MKNLIAMAMALGCAVGCGGGDGTLLRDATVEDARDLCEFSNDNLAPATTCDVNGTQVPFEAEEPQDCSMISGENDFPETCDATIGDAKDCIEALADDPCSVFDDQPPPGCEEVFTEDCIPPEDDARVAGNAISRIKRMYGL